MEGKIIDHTGGTESDIVAWFALIISLVLAVNTLLGQSSNVIIPDGTITVRQGGETDLLDLSVQNIGGRPAYGFNYFVYGVMVGMSDSVEKLFDEKVINPIYPDTVSRVSTLITFHKNRISGEDLLGRRVVLLIVLKYTDRLKGSQQRHYLYVYSVGGTEIRPLSISDYEQVSCPLMEYMESQDRKHNETTIRFLNQISSTQKCDEV